MQLWHHFAQNAGGSFLNNGEKKRKKKISRKYLHLFQNSIHPQKLVNMARGQPLAWNDSRFDRFLTKNHTSGKCPLFVSSLPSVTWFQQKHDHVESDRYFLVAPFLKKIMSDYSSMTLTQYDLLLRSLKFY